MNIDFDTARQTMVDQQIRPWEVIDPLVLDAFAKVRREDFVPPRQRKLAFADVALPLEHGEFMFKPVLEGRLLQALELAPEHEVLEIGTGSGYLTACLGHIARAVSSIDRREDFVLRARGRLENLGFSCARIEVADALEYRPGRQFDSVLVGGAVAELPAPLLDWVRVGGRLVVVRGHSPVQECVAMTRVTESSWREESLFETDIPYLHGAEPRARFVL
jgi:protein-L-isoaspartate(D-aspartate) O-methyltransferase